MVQSESLRFADMRVGQQLPATAANLLGETSSWSELAERYVRDWAGPGALIARHDTQPSDSVADEVDEVIGSIYARHLDDSLNIDVKVVGRTGSGATLVNIVRVRLS